MTEWTLACHVMLRLIWFLPRDIASVVYTIALCPSNAITRQWHNVRTTDIPFPFPLSFLPISSFAFLKGMGLVRYTAGLLRVRLSSVIPAVSQWLHVFNSVTQ